MTKYLPSIYWSRVINIIAFPKLEKTFENPLACKEIKPISPKGNQSWVFIGRTDAEVETPILWLPDVKNWFIGKDPDAGQDWRQEQKEMAEDEMVRWHHWLSGHEFEQALEVGDGQQSLGCCSRGVTKSYTTEQVNWMNWTELNPPLYQGHPLALGILSTKHPFLGVFQGLSQFPLLLVIILSS